MSYNVETLLQTVENLEIIIDMQISK